MTPAQAPLRVYLDQDVDVLLASLLAAHGLDCVTALAAGHLGWADEAHLIFATQEERVLVTHNRVDFENLAVSWWHQNKDHAGIVLAIRRANTYDLARHALPMLGLFDQTGWRNQILYA